MHHPYYLVALRHTRTSAGVRVLYRFADLINKAGGSAYIFLWPRFNLSLASSPTDIAPFLTKKVADYHFNNGLAPIVVYPETVNVSRFCAPVRVRYLLNYDELLFKNEPFDSDDYLLSYSDAIDNQIKVNKPRSTLFLPVSDPVFFSPAATQGPRVGGAFYAGKYKYHFNGKTFPVTDGMPEITRDRPDSQTPEQIRDLFRRIELFYCYEDSALALEAILCGCPTVFLPNEHFKAPLAAKELEGLGFAWGTSPDQIQHAKDTVDLARLRYFQRLDKIQGEVKLFIGETQVIAAKKKYEIPFAANYLKNPGVLQRTIDTALFLSDVIKDKGLIKTVKTIFKRIGAGRFKI
jgi:hypothetical protein